MAAAVLLAFSFLFGGASRLHEMRLALVELAALPLLVMTATAWLKREQWPGSQLALGLMTGLILIPIIQLIPLPVSVWSHIPGHAEIALALDLTQIKAGWLPLSLTPELTWHSLLALIPPVAMFLAVLVRGPDLGRGLIWISMAFCLVCAVVGAAQVAGVDRLYLWPTTDRGMVTGLFANRNHLATLCLATLPFASVFAASSLRGRYGDRKRLWIGLLYIVLMVFVLAAVRSRAGIVLLLPALAGSFLAAWVAAGRGAPRLPLFAACGGLAVLLIAISVFALGPLLDRFDSSADGDSRLAGWALTAETADAYLPLGSGLGSFDAVYRSVEPLEQLGPKFFNHAHNEYLETWLETGWMGVALIAAFLLWWARRSWSVWRASASTSRDLQRAASVAILLMLLHSAVDYPLRTETLAVFMAICCALLELGGLSRGRMIGDPEQSRVR